MHTRTQQSVCLGCQITHPAVHTHAAAAPMHHTPSVCCACVVVGWAVCVGLLTSVGGALLSRAHPQGGNRRARRAACVPNHDVLVLGCCSTQPHTHVVSVKAPCRPRLVLCSPASPAKTHMHCCCTHPWCRPHSLPAPHGLPAGLCCPCIQQRPTTHLTGSTP